MYYDEYNYWRLIFYRKAHWVVSLLHTVILSVSLLSFSSWPQLLAVTLQVYLSCKMSNMLPLLLCKILIAHSH